MPPVTFSPRRRSDHFPLPDDNCGPVERPACHACGARPLRLRKCTGKCGGAAQYCDEACQRSHWKAHKPACKGAGGTASAAASASTSAAGGAAAGGSGGGGCSSSAAPQQEAPPLAPEDLRALSVKELKKRAAELGLDSSKCLYKDDLVALISSAAGAEASGRTSASGAAAAAGGGGAPLD